MLEFVDFIQEIKFIGEKGEINPLEMVAKYGQPSIYHDFSKIDRTWQASNGVTLADGAGEAVALAMEESRWNELTPEAVFSANTFEDQFNYADQAALIAAGYTVSEPGGATGVEVPGNGTIIVRDVGGSDSLAGKLMTGFPVGAYRSFIDLVAKDPGITSAGGRIRMGVSAVGAEYVNSVWTFTALSANPGVYQVVGSGGFGFVTAVNPAFALHASDAGLGFTAGGIRLQCAPGFHALQTGASGLRPVRQAGGIIRCDGVDDFLLSRLVPNNGAFTLGFRAQLTSGGVLRIVLGSRTTGQDNRVQLGFDASNQLTAFVGGSTPITRTGSLLNAMGTGFVVFNGSSAILYWEEEPTAPVVCSLATAPTIGFGIGALNTSATFTSHFSGDINKAIFIPAAVTPSEIKGLTRYMNNH